MTQLAPSKTTNAHPTDTDLAIPGIPAIPDISTIVPPQSTINVLVQISNSLAKSGMPLPKSCHTPEAIFRILLTGAELGLTPMVALNEIDVINGKASLNTRTKIALIRKRGLGNIEPIASTPTTATVEVSKSTWDVSNTVQLTFNAEDAKRAGLTGKDTWKKYPTAMLLHRAEAMACSAYFQEVFVGIGYSPDELGAETDESGRAIESFVDNGPSWAGQSTDADDEIDAASAKPKPTDTRTIPWSGDTDAHSPPTPQCTDLDAPVGNTDTAPGVESGIRKPAITPQSADTSANELTRIQQMVKLSGLNQDQWRAHLKHHTGQDSIKGLSTTQLAGVRQWIEQAATIKTLYDDRGFTNDQWTALLAQHNVTTEFQIGWIALAYLWNTAVRDCTPFRRSQLGIEVPPANDTALGK